MAPELLNFAAVGLPELSWTVVVWQTLLVAAGSFVMLTLTMSHFRYQRLLREAQQALETGGATGDLKMWLVDQIGRRRVQLLQLQTGVPLAGLRERVRPCLRSTDLCLMLRPDRLLVVLSNTEAVHVSRVAYRLHEALKTDVACGRMTVAGLPEPGGYRQKRLTLAEEIVEALSVPESLPEGWELPPPPEPFRVEIQASQEGILDPVTQLLHPDRVGSAVQKMLAAHRRREQPVCLVLTRIDEIKSYTETFGDVGRDALLRQAAETWMANCRESDLIGRLDDEHFVVLMSGKSEVILPTVQRVLSVVRQQACLLDNQEIRYTMGAAVVGFPEHAIGPGPLFRNAHATLAEVSTRGRNVALVYDPSLRPAPVQQAAQESF